MFNSNLNILSEVCKGDISQIKLMKHKDANFHWSTLFFPKTKETCLHLAAQCGHTDIIFYLLNEFHPRAVDVRNVDNKTPLHFAAQFGQYNSVKILTDNGADINAIKRSDWTPLMLACTKSDDVSWRIVEYLLERDAILNFKNKDGWTCLHLAARNYNSNILKLLLTSSKLDVTARTKNGRNALHISSLHGNLENVKLLINKLDPNSIDSSGNTPFHEAILSGKLEVVDYLVANGADIHVVNKTGSNALHLAAGQDLDYVIRHLVCTYKLGVDKVDSNGYTALHCAVRKCSNSAVKVLLELGANRNVVDKCGRLPQDYSSEKIKEL